MNQVTLKGNLGADCELRYTKNATPVANIRLATHEFYKDANGEKQKRTDWHSVVMFGQVAEKLAEHLKKGRGVLISGSLQTNKWTDRDGNTRYTTQVKARNIDLLPSGQRREDDAPPPSDDDLPNGF